MINFWEIWTPQKIKLPIGTKKVELVPRKTCPKIKDPCRHSVYLKHHVNKIFSLCKMFYIQEGNEDESKI